MSLKMKLRASFILFCNFALKLQSETIDQTGWQVFLCHSLWGWNLVSLQLNSVIINHNILFHLTEIKSDTAPHDDKILSII